MIQKLIDAYELEREMYRKCIDTDEEIEKGRAKWDSGLWIRYKVFEDTITLAPGVDPVKHGHWIPVKYRPMDSEEREYWEEHIGEELADADAVMFDCPMPEDGQEILVSYRKWISMDKCEIDGGCYGLEGNGDWDGIIAWMPLPEPYEVEDGLEATDNAEPVKHGCWKPTLVVDDCFWVCSICGFPSEASGANILYKYCPVCGAKMDEVADDES